MTPSERTNASAVTIASVAAFLLVHWLLTTLGPLDATPRGHIAAARTGKANVGKQEIDLVLRDVQLDMVHVAWAAGADHAVEHLEVRGPGAGGLVV